MTEARSRDLSYLEHMLEAIGRIQRYVGRKRRAGFLGDALLQDAVIRNIEIVGEAAGGEAVEARASGLPPAASPRRRPGEAASLSSRRRP